MPEFRQIGRRRVIARQPGPNHATIGDSQIDVPIMIEVSGDNAEARASPACIGQSGRGRRIAELSGNVLSPERVSFFR